MCDPQNFTNISPVHTLQNEHPEDINSLKDVAIVVQVCLWESESDLFQQTYDTSFYKELLYESL